MKVVKITLLIFVGLSLFCHRLYAKEALILYTGQTHAMLYQCSCPVQKDGGVARRGTLVKKLRKSYPELLLLDCGSFTAGGLMDEYTQGVELDKQRSLDNFRTMQLLGYDAVGISPDEFNFGKEFFLNNANKNKPVFLSANLDSNKVLPQIIKEVNGVKIGVIGLTNVMVNQNMSGIKINMPKAVQERVNALKQKGVEVVVVLSTLGEKEDLKLIAQVKGIDIIFVGYNPLKDESFVKIDSTYLLRPSWQGRKLGKLTLDVKNGKLINCQAEQIRLSDEIVDDPDILAAIPRCYLDANCKKEGFVGSCKDPGELKSACLFTQPKKINLMVIETKDCPSCNPASVIEFLKRQFPGLTTKHLDLADPVAEKLVKDLSIISLPAYLLGPEVENEKNFNNLKNGLSLSGNYYLVKPQTVGRAYFLNRKAQKGTLDMFLNMFDNHAAVSLALTKEFNPRLHFLAIETEQGFDARNGNFEIEEYLRGVCMQRYFPDKFWDYLSCRLKNMDSYYWEDCLSVADAGKVKSCAQGPQGAKLLKENIALGSQLQVNLSSTYLFDNNLIVYSQGVPDREELRKLIKNKETE